MLLTLLLFEKEFMDGSNFILGNQDAHFKKKLGK